MTLATQRRVFRLHKHSLVHMNLCILVLLSTFLNIRGTAEAKSTFRAKSTAAYTVSGTTFDDFNQNGTQDTGDLGINGIVVKAYNSAGTVVATTTTATSGGTLGQYTLTIPNGTGPVRVQFTNFGTSSTVPELVGFQPTYHTGGSPVNFVAGTLATNTVNLGIERPSEYCQNNPNMITNCYIRGDQTAVGLHVLVRFPYNSTGLETVTPPTAVADDTNVGSTWGLAYRRSSDSLFSAAYTKQLTSYKPGGSTGAIYLTQSANATPSTNAAAFVDLNALFGANTAGANPHTTTNNYNPDLSAFDAVGKIGIGGLAVSEDDATLYAINLADRKLYSMPIGAAPTAPVAPAAAAITRTSIPTPLDCILAADVRPFAVTVYRNLVYVGAVCSAQSTVVPVTAPNGDSTKLRAYVFVYTPGTGFTAAPVFDVPLNYPRHCTWFGSSICSPAPWRAWMATSATAYSNSGAYPQPMLTGIAFNKGDLLLGLRDRYGDQGAYQVSGYPEPIGGGDLLRACLNTAGNPSSGWTLENNAVCGATTITAGQNNNKGPGNGEYYYQQNYLVDHDYTSMGGIVQIPGNSTVMTSAFDPVSNFETGGLRTYDDNLGTKTNGYELYDSHTSPSTTYGKANGIGGLVALCQSAPIEIGNRVWFDANGNGIQDANEPGIAGVTVNLYAANGTTLLQTTTTDANGNYYFTISSYTSYVVKLNNSTNYTTGPLKGYRLSVANQDPAHLVDSDAVLPTPASPIGTNNYPQMAIGSHTPGQNDGTFDVGMLPPPDIALTKTVA